MNLYDMLRAAGGGEGLRSLASRYGLSETDMLRAAEALLPAFSLALNRIAADPHAFSEFARRMMAPDYLGAYRQPAAAAATGEEALAFLFGSPATAGAIADQASAFAGLAAETTRKLMPSLAALLMGGLADQGRQANPFLDAMLKQFDTAEPKRPAAKGPLDRYEEEQVRRQQKAAEELAATQAEMVRGGMAAFEAGAEAWATAFRGAPKQSGEASGSPAEAAALGRMFEPGLNVAEDYRRTLEALLGGGAPNKDR